MVEGSISRRSRACWLLRNEWTAGEANRLDVEKGALRTKRENRKCTQGPRSFINGKNSRRRGVDRQGGRAEVQELGELLHGCSKARCGCPPRAVWREGRAGAKERKIGKGGWRAIDDGDEGQPRPHRVAFLGRANLFVSSCSRLWRPRGESAPADRRPAQRQARLNPRQPEFGMRSSAFTCVIIRGKSVPRCKD